MVREAERALVETPTDGEGARHAAAQPPSARAQPGAGRPPGALDRADAAFQRSALEGVSRTFALTIPVLPERLEAVVGNAYLLCRIADTIEDEPGLTRPEKVRFHSAFAAAVEGRGDAGAFAADLGPRLSARTLPAERDLVRDTAHVLAITHGFDAPERSALERCVRVMCERMDRFQEGRSGRGLADVAELSDYCYVVAGVVGELLTELFCAHAPEVAAQREELVRRAVSFGQGLQMTNILKDVWEDWERGFCWLPRTVFERHGVDLSELDPAHPPPGFRAGMDELVGIAHGHLRAALDYTLAIPRQERGMRNFCLWALGMALLTLRKVHRRPDFRSAREVKISRRAVRATVFVSRRLAGRDALLRAAFGLCALGLPRASAPDAEAVQRSSAP